MSLVLAGVFHSLGAPHAVAQTPIADLADIRLQFENVFESRRLQNQPYGQYRMRPGDAGPSYYASLDVAISRTIMGEELVTSLDESSRTEWISHLHSYARPDGTYSDTFGHNQLHANGMTIGALGPLQGKQLFPADPIYTPFDEANEVANYLSNNINWSNQWTQSHKFWGGLHVFSESSQATPEWKDAVFDWLDSNVDPATGWWRIGQPPNDDRQGLGGGAHIWPIYEHQGRAFPEPERVIDRILGMQVAGGRFGGNNSGYMDLDALYGLRYMRSLSPNYRASEIDQAVEDFGVWLAGDITGYLASGPTMHGVLAKVGGFGLLNQLAPELFPDTTGAQWSDIFTDQRLYQTAAVETFTTPDLTPIGQDQPSLYSSTIMSDGPVGYWRMGQTGGYGAADASGNDLPGLYIGVSAGSGPGHMGQPGLQSSEGYVGLSPDNRAVHFDSFSSYVSVADSAELDITSGLTIEAWIKLDDFPISNGGIVSKYFGDGDQRSYQIYVHKQNDGTGSLAMIVSPDGTFSSAASLIDDVSLPLDEWVHVVGVYEPSQFMQLFVNGELVEESTSEIPSSIYSSTADLWIGQQFNTSSNFHLPGSIDEAALYNRALTAGEILEHYQAALTLSGDFDGNGIVDGADFLEWQRGLGTLYNAEDLQVWNSSYGVSAPGATASAIVPEPAAASLFCCSLIVWVGSRRRILHKEYC